MDINLPFSRAEEVSQDLLDRFLAPYKPDCRYLNRAVFHYPDQAASNGSAWGFMKADFAIPESCYIDDTGHFNSVEFNICYNQLFYVLIAYLVKHQLLKAMHDWDLETYKRRQLNDFLITRFASTFRKPINSDTFQGMLSINKCAARSRLISFKTACAFYDETGWSEGEVTVCVVDQTDNQSSAAKSQHISLSTPV